MMEPDNDAAPGDGSDDGEFVFAPPGPTIVPYFGYRDAAAAITFLTEVLGFEVLSRYEGPNGEVMHAELSIGDGIIMLGSLPADAPDDLLPGAMGTYVAIDDVETHHADALVAGLEAAGGALVYGPQDTEFGTRRYRVRDPEGFEWSFGTYRPTFTV